jgi:DNA (cytosine-5)-methyltransferase 1
MPGIIGMELDRCLSDLAGEGYESWPVVIPACAVDARHRRDRVWIVAHRKQPGLQGHAGDGKDRDEPGRIGTEARGSTGAGGVCGDVAQSDSINGRLGAGGQDRAEAGDYCGDVSDSGCWSGEGPGPGQRGEPVAAWWLPEPDIRRVAHGIPARVDRLKGLGNAIVPQVAAELMRMILRF